MSGAALEPDCEHGPARPVAGRGGALPVGASLAAFAAAILLYALCGTPTPDAPGPAEAAIGLLLLCAVGPRRALAALAPPLRGPGWRRAGWLLLAYGLSVPLAAGAVSGHAPVNILRDVLPFLFLLLPLFAAPLFAGPGREARRRLLCGLAAFAGLAFAARVAGPAAGRLAAALAGGGLPRLASADPFYLVNAPTVLFAAVFLFGAAGAALYRNPGFTGHIKAALGVALGTVPLAAMALVGQRAGCGWFCLAILLLAAIGLVRNPARALWPAVLLAALAALAWPDISLLAQGLARKTVEVGVNSRDSEAAAVIRLLQDSAPAALFGKGWGATFASPAVGGVTVNFTHSLITSFWLKAGLAGAGLALAYLGLICRGLWPVLRARPVLALALAGPLLIDILLYASFKSLDFGLILLLAAVSAEAEKEAGESSNGNIMTN
jgi:hypothetical protein